ncbi:histonelysine Nmethyltransferase SETMARlike [Trichonephila clavipes]|nr:histonelysine Nmethyltransferase SETMARlike [Trichonephila clavipes]
MAVVSISREVSIKQFQIYAHFQGILDVKVVTRTDKLVIENVDKITKVTEIDRDVSSHRIAQELEIIHKTVLSYLSKLGFKKNVNVWMLHHITPKTMTDRISFCKALAKQNTIDPFLTRMSQTLNSDRFYQQRDHLKLATDQKWLEWTNRSGVVFHQDNAMPHTYVVTRQNFWELGWEVLMHTPYSPDLAPNDYHLFSLIGKLPER